MSFIKKPKTVLIRLMMLAMLFGVAHTGYGREGKADKRNKTVSMVEETNDFREQSGNDVKYDVNASTQQNKQAAQQKGKPTVARGKVVDQEGLPLTGASVRVKGTALGATTNVDGEFTIKLPTPPNGKDNVLVITFIGMEKKEVRCRDSRPMHIVMDADAVLMEEVAIVENGYNSLPRKDMVGAFTTIKAEDILMPAYSSIDQMLQGKVSGMVVVNSSARVGASPKITIRGTSTILGNTSPLWVVDGIIQEDPISIDVSSSMTTDMKELIGNQVAWLNPQDIETITVLKDASATAIYGSKASNGVIVITTKRGSAERTSIRYTNNFSVRMRPTYDNFDFMNSRERIQFSKEAYDAGVRYSDEPLPQKYTYEGLMAMFNNRMITEEEFAYQMQRLETVNTNWFDILTRNSLSHSHTVSVSGGTKKFTYNASLGYQGNKGTEIGNDNNMFSSRLAINAQLTRRLSVSLNLNGTMRDAKGYGAGVSPYSYAMNTSRSVPCYEEDGSLAYYQNYYTYRFNAIDGAYNKYGYNILNEMANSGSKNKSTSFNASLNISYKILDWLTYQAVGGIARSGNDSEAYAGERSSYIERHYRGYAYGSEESGSAKFKAAMLPFGGQLTTNNSMMTSMNMQHKLMFSKTFNEAHRVNAMMGMEMRSSKTNSVGNTVWGYVPERGEILVSPTRPEDLVPMGMEQEVGWGALDQLYQGGWKKTSGTTNYMSFFATLAYSMKDRYVLNFNVRSDASNRFGQDVNKQFDPTYSMGFSWRMAEEKFIKDNLPWVNQLNLRGTYGIQGNVVTSLSPDLIAYYQGILNGYGQYTLGISSLPNRNLKWERTRTWNLGLDMQLFRAVTMNVEYYGRRSNAIIRQDIATEYGFASMPLNGGIIYNHGLEVQMNFTPFRSKDLVWTVGLNASKNWNKTETDDRTARADELTHSDFLAGNSSRPLKKGYSLYSFWSYSFAGLNPENGYPMFNYLDTDGPGNASVDPTTFLVYSGESEPYFTGGFNTRLRWKDFTIGADFALLLGSKKRLPNPYGAFTNGKMPSPLSNISKMLNNRWKKPGDEATTFIPALYTSIVDLWHVDLPNGLNDTLYNMWGMSDAMVVSGSFLRCTQLQLSYNLPQSICAKFHATSLSINASTNNLFVIASGRWNGYDPELGNSTQPRIFSFGLSVGF